MIQCASPEMNQSIINKLDDLRVMVPELSAGFEAFNHSGTANIGLFRAKAGEHSSGAGFIIKFSRSEAEYCFYNSYKNLTPELSMGSPSVIYISENDPPGIFTIVMEYFPDGLVDLPTEIIVQFSRILGSLAASDISNWPIPIHFIPTEDKFLRYRASLDGGYCAAAEENFPILDWSISEHGKILDRYSSIPNVLANNDIKLEHLKLRAEIGRNPSLVVVDWGSFSPNKVGADFHLLHLESRNSDQQLGVLDEMMRQYARNVAQWTKKPVTLEDIQFSSCVFGVVQNLNWACDNPMEYEFHQRLHFGLSRLRALMSA